MASFKTRGQQKLKHLIKLLLIRFHKFLMLESNWPKLRSKCTWITNADLSNRSTQILMVCHFSHFIRIYHRKRNNGNGWWNFSQQPPKTEQNLSKLEKILVQICINKTMLNRLHNLLFCSWCCVVMKLTKI